MVVLNDSHFGLLEAFLDCVKSNGGDTLSDDILAIDGKFISPLSHGIEGAAASAINILHKLKDLVMILNALRKAVENGLSMAQKELLPATRHHGILSLPLEIVSHVFRQVHNDDANCAIQSIPLVNRYFRDVAIGTPELWTHLTQSRNPRLFMERSKLLGLKVDLSTGRSPHYRYFLEMVASEAERWTSLSIPSRYKLGEEYVKWTRDFITGKTFAALQELCIEGHEYACGSLWDWCPLYKDSKMPSLRIIKSNNALPSMPLASLTHLHLRVSNSDHLSRIANICLQEITMFLQSVPFLTELSFDISLFENFAFRTGTNATLPNVKTLQLGVRADGGADSSLTDFLASLRMPNISDFSVDMTTNCASQLTGWISVIFPEGNSFWPPLESLDLGIFYKFRDYDDEDGAGIPGPYDLFKIIPIVHHLSIHADGVDPLHPAYWNVELPHLRTLCFRDCEEIDANFILDIGRICEAPGFETLVIHNCEKIDTEVVRRRMPEGKALVRTYDWYDDISVL